MPVGLNPRIRILRYDATDNDRFEPHFDATTYIDTNHGQHHLQQQQQRQKSLLTVLIYLNNGGGIDFSGGETCYLDSHISTSSPSLTTATALHHGNEPNIVPRSTSVTKVLPETGKVVIFEHDLYHSGAPLISGTKYVLRTDVMFLPDSECIDEVEALQHGAEEGTEDSAEPGSFQRNNSSIPLPSSAATTNLVRDLCHSLDISEENMANLDSMCLLDMTIENLFASVSIPSVKSILHESGISAEIINQFVNTGLLLLKQVRLR
jgi:hypothetical protein